MPRVMSVALPEIDPAPDPAADPEADPAIPRLSRAGLGLAWGLFWLLLMTVGVQDHLRQGFHDLWRPLLWEGSSCLVATLVLGAQWRRLHRLDRWLTQPAHWFARSLLPLPLAAPAFVAAVYALRHGVYAALGQSYTHEPWGQVFRYEMLKFSLFYLLFVAVLFGLRSHAALSAQRLRSERAQALMREAQLLQLTQQIEPHFLFNALNTIASTVHGNAALADALLTQLATLLRAATDLARRPEVTLADELRLLEAYGAIMRERFAGRVTLRFEIAPEALTCRVPTLLLQPLLENAFRHGVERQTAASEVTVRGRRDGDRLTLEVEGTAGTLAAQPVFGVGLTNLRQRLALRHGDAATLSLTPRAGGGAIARILMPCGV